MRSLVSPQAVIITNDGAGSTLLVHSAWFLSMFEVPVPDDRNIHASYSYIMPHSQSAFLLF